MKFFAKTDLGKIRHVNQDYYIAENRKVGIFPNLFLVADGVGSNRDSAFASKHCSDFVIDQLSLSKAGADFKDELAKAYRLANADLVYRIFANPEYRGMGTTMVLCTIINDRAIVVNVGDSRCYHIGNYNIKQVTRDHSIAEELVYENAIERESEKYKELKSQLSRAFGAGKKIEPDFFDVDLMAGDYILLCTDGLSNMVSNERIYEIVNSEKAIEAKVEDLIDEANRNGGRDNIAIILIYIDKVNKDNSVFDKDRRELNEQVIHSLNNKEDKENKPNIKDILNYRVSRLNKDFVSRSRKKKEGDNDEQ